MAASPLPGRARFALLGPLLVAGIACAPALRVSYLDDAPRGFPVSAPGRVTLFRRLPARPHLRFAQIVFRVKPGTERAEAERRLRRKAARIGADGLLVVRDDVWGEPVVEPGSQVWSRVYSDRMLVAIAIRFVR